MGLTITAASGAELAARGINSVDDLQKIVPGFKASESIFETPVYTLRGIGLNDYSLGSTPAVAVYQDQASAALPHHVRGGRGSMSGRVEVLKGPQGTLFGQSSTGGAVNYIANQPGKRFEAGVDVGYDSYNQTDVSGFASGPLTDTLGARVAVEAVEGGAWQKNVSLPPNGASSTRGRLGDARKVTGRIILDWRPTSAFKANLALTVNQDHSDVQATQFTRNVLNVYGSPAQATAAGEAPISQNPYAVVDPARFASLTTPRLPRLRPQLPKPPGAGLPRVRPRGRAAASTTWVPSTPEVTPRWPTTTPPLDRCGVNGSTRRRCGSTTS